MAATYFRHWSNQLPVWLLKVVINLWPPFLGAGIKIKKISTDYRHVEVIMKLRWYNKNYIGTHFGGSIFSMTDPFYMLMLIKNLGSDYLVLDKSAQIDFKKPGRGMLRATFQFSEEEIQHIRNQANYNEKFILDRSVDVINQDAVIVATVIKTLYVRRKEKRTTS